MVLRAMIPRAGVFAAHPLKQGLKLNVCRRHLAVIMMVKFLRHIH